MKPKEKLIEELTKTLPVYQWGCISTEEITFHPEVREICQRNSCGQYGKSWSCPPAFGTYEECRDFCRSFDRAFVFTGKYELEDSYDFEGMIQAQKTFLELCRQIRARWQEEYGACTLLGNGSCGYCARCTYPDAPCRFPEKMIPSLEGYGVLVNLLAQAASVRYANGPDTVTYFGAVLYRD